MFFEVMRRDMSICAGDYHDHILAVPCGDDLGDSGRSGFNSDGCRVNTGGFQVGAELGAKGIVAEFSDHTHSGTKAGGGDSGQTNQEKEKHKGDEFAGVGGSIGELLPDEHSPDGGNHGGSLSNGIGNRGANDLCVGSNKVQYRSRAPNRATENSPEVPESRTLPVVANADGSSTGHRLAH